VSCGTPLCQRELVELGQDVRVNEDACAAHAYMPTTVTPEHGAPGGAGSTPTRCRYHHVNR
jgi:hypothetical protein